MRSDRNRIGKTRMLRACVPGAFTRGRRAWRILAGFCAWTLLAETVLSMPEAVWTARAEEAVEEAGAAPEAEGAGGESEDASVIEIATAEELIAFAENCHDDAWSVGKTIRLVEDINLAGTEFTSVPIFNGTFDGEKHRVTGYTYGGDGYVSGFFRYIGAQGVVENFVLYANLASTENAQCTGGIAGANAGTLRNCYFYGSISGNRETGGIAGINQPGGIIDTCKNHARVAGFYYTGGIVGKNYGMIRNSRNYGNVNDSVDWVQRDDERSNEVLSTFADEEDTVSIQSGIDTGGIAGYSEGVLSGCRNTSIIGYEHVGYNIGGIVGRQSGTVDSCVNEGTVYGKKDVGGIVGQQEPYIEVNQAESIRKSVEALGVQVDRMIEDAGDAGETIQSDLRELQSRSREVRSTATDMAEEANGYLNESISAINSGLEILEQYGVDLSELDLSGLDLTGVDLSKVDLSSVDVSDPEQVRAAIERATGARELTGPITVDEAGNVQNGTEEALSRAQSGLEEALDQVEGELPEENLTNTSERAGQAADGIKQSAENAIAGEGQSSEDAKQAAESAVQSAEDARRAAEENVRQSAEEANRARGEATLRLQGTSDDWNQNLSSLSAQLDSVSEMLTLLGEDTGSYSEALNNDIAAVNNQIGRIYGMIAELVGGLEDNGLDYLFADISEDALNYAETGITLRSTNHGTVRGDINVGGIAGNLSVDTENMESNVIATLGLNTGETYTLANIISSSTNRGFVTSRSDGAGGIAGNVDSGLIYSCYGYGTAESTDGNYVGGIAGRSEGLILNSYALCSLAGKDSIGGIAGFGTKIRGCIAMPIITSYTGNAGAIAGQTDQNSLTKERKLMEIRDNYFVSEALYGIDEINYADGAARISYEELLAMDGLPYGFRNLQVSFRANRVPLGSERLAYGESLEALTFPEIPEREGYYAQWPDVSGRIMNGNLVIDAEYFPTVRTLESETRFGETGKPLAFAEGAFEAGDCVQVDSDPAATVYLKAEDRSVEDAYLYQVEILRGGSAEETAGEESEGDAADGEESRGTEPVEYRLRLYAPYGEKDVNVWMRTLSGDEFSEWVSVEASARGSYLDVTLTGSKGLFLIEEKPSALVRKIVVGAAIGAGVIVLLLLLRAVRRAARKAKQKRDAKIDELEDAED